MKVCVSGGAGFIGHHIVNKFLSLGYEIIVLDDLSTGKIENLPKECQFIKTDLSTIDIDLLITYLRGVDYVFHTAAKARVQPSIKDPLKFNSVNVDSTLKLLYASYKNNIKRFIYSASSSVYGNAETFPTVEETTPNPLSPYGLQKYIGEQYCKLFSSIYGLDTVSLRYFNVYGENMLDEGAYCTVIGIFSNLYKNNKPLTITNDGNQKRDFTYVGDVVDANYLSAVYPDKLNGISLNVGNGKNYSVNEIADLFKCEKVYSDSVIEPFETLSDNNKLRNLLGWVPKGDVVSWVKNHIKNINKI